MEEEDAEVGGGQEAEREVEEVTEKQGEEGGEVGKKMRRKMKRWEEEKSFFFQLYLQC